MSLISIAMILSLASLPGALLFWRIALRPWTDSPFRRTRLLVIGSSYGALVILLSAFAVFMTATKRGNAPEESLATPIGILTALISISPLLQALVATLVSRLLERYAHDQPGGASRIIQD